MEQLSDLLEYEFKLLKMPTIPPKRLILLKALRKLASPRELRKFLEYKFVSGNEYPYFDFADFFPRLSAMLTSVGRQRLDIDSPIFIAGLRRSGTTVFYRVMNANSSLFLFNERFPGDRMNGRGVSTHRNIYTVDDPHRLRSIVSRYLSPRLRSRSERWGVKLALELAHPDPGSVSMPGMQHILAAFPRAKVIGITRDPRDFVLSAITRGGHDVKWWIDEYEAVMDLYSKLLISHRDSFITVRYEDLLTDAEQTVHHCCEFAGIPFERDMLDPSKWSVKGPREYENKGIVRQIDKWRRVSGADLEIVQRVTESCFPQATQFGYAAE
jgi:hypothetical protein